MFQQNTGRKDCWGNIFFWLIVGPFAALVTLPAMIAGTAHILTKLLLAAGILVLLTTIISFVL